MAELEQTHRELGGLVELTWLFGRKLDRALRKLGQAAECERASREGRDARDARDARPTSTKTTSTKRAARFPPGALELGWR